MATAKQIAANRRNAQKSCGPPKASNESSETKAKVARNGVEHGLCGQFCVLKEVEKQVKSGAIPVAVDFQLEAYVRYHPAQDRAYQRASSELRKRKKARQLDEIGFASQKRAQAEESRKAEKHAVQMAVANLRKQREGMKLGDALAKMLPPDFDLSTLDRVFSAASLSPSATEPPAVAVSMRV